MSKQELLERRARSMARSMEVEGADFETSKREILSKLRSMKRL